MADQGLSPTRVGVLGSGQVGQTLARGFADRGHEVMIGSRDPAKDELAAWLAGDGRGIASGDFAETAQHGELLVLAVLGVAVEEAIDAAGAERFTGKVVIDATNPLDFSDGFPPKLAWGHTDSGGERVQRAIPQARVVKAFNIIGSPHFVQPRFSEGQPTMLIAGDDDDAKQTVAAVVADFGWPPAIDIGGIEGSRQLEELCILWVKLGGVRSAWDHGFKLLQG
jgi:8-hydroxy-5-deazaflavin:NADPH oxidoreductase